MSQFGTVLTGDNPVPKRISKPRKPVSKTAKELSRSALLSDVAKIFVYWDVELSKYYAREVVRKLVDWGLVDATLPLRDPDRT